MKIYEKPIIEINVYKIEDFITASGAGLHLDSGKFKGLNENIINF